MNDAPEITFEQIKLSRKKASGARVTTAGLRYIAQCAEGEQLKQQYDSTLEAVEEAVAAAGPPFQGGPGLSPAPRRSIDQQERKPPIGCTSIERIAHFVGGEGED